MHLSRGAACVSQVPGSVIATDSAIEFVQVVARIKASEFLGVRALPVLPPAVSTPQSPKQQANGQLGMNQDFGTASGVGPSERLLAALQAEAEGSTWSQRTRQSASAGAGVLSGTAAWLLQRVRRSSSAGGGLQDSAEGCSTTSSDSASMLPSISDMCVYLSRLRLYST